ncbi:MAG: hypothetical protein EAZ80_13655, partial [Runella slithyformis]
MSSAPGTYVIQATFGTCLVSDTIQITSTNLTLSLPFVSANGVYYNPINVNGTETYPLCSGLGTTTILIENAAYQNNLNPLAASQKETSFLRLKFKGEKHNVQGLGATVQLFYGNNQTQVYEHSPYRGYLSSVETIAHFGLGKHQVVPEVKVIWPDGKGEIFKKCNKN